MFPSEISFSTPEWLVNFYHVATVLSLLINSLGIHLIMFHSGKIDNFKYFLLWFTICCLMADVGMFFLMQPIPLTPIWAGYINGPFRSIFRLSCHTSSTIVGFVIGQQFAALTMCFVRKYQAISKIDTTNSISSAKLVLTAVLLQFIVIVWLIAYHFTEVDKPTAMEIIRKDYAEYTVKFLELDDFSLYVPNTTTQMCMMTAGVCAAVCTAIIIFSTVRMLKLLKTLEQQVSHQNLKRHRSAVTSLVAQFLTSAVAIIPPVGCGILLFAEFRYVQLSVWIMLAVFSCHGVLNCLVMAFTYPPYRNQITSVFCYQKNSPI